MDINILFPCLFAAPVSRKSRNSWRTFSTVKNSTAASTPTRRWPTEPRSRRPFSQETRPRRFVTCCWSMWRHSRWVWRRPVECSRNWWSATLVFPPRRRRSSPPTRTISPLWRFKCMRENAPWPRIIICWAGLTWSAFHPHLVVSRKLKVKTSNFILSFWCVDWLIDLFDLPRFHWYSDRLFSWLINWLIDCFFNAYLISSIFL